MEPARVQREQTKSEPPRERAQRGQTSDVRWPLAFNDAHSPVLRLDYASGSSRAALPRGLQAKLTVNQPGDQFEQEADRVADQVMRMSEPALRLQRKCGCGGATTSDTPCVECSPGQSLVQRSAPRLTTSETHGTHDLSVPHQVQQVLRSLGQPLDHSTRAFMETRFGQDFSHVRVHTDPRAAESSTSVNALAYTVGNNVIFGPGQYAPHTTQGRQLLAHELTHVIQQQSGNISGRAKGPGPIALKRQETEASHQKSAFQPSASPVQVKENAGAGGLQRRIPPGFHGAGRSRRPACHADLCFHPIGMFGLGRAGALHGILDVTGSHGRRTMEIDPTQHMGCLPHSHVRVASGSRGGGRGCIPIALTCQQADAAVAAASAYEAMSVTYNPPPGPNSNSFPEWVLERADVNTSAISTPVGALGWGYFIRNPSERNSPPSIATPPLQSECREPIRAARNHREFVRLLILAERRMRVAGLSQERQLYGLASIYYGAVWSRDFAVEHSCVRNLGFRGFSGHPLDITDEGPDTPHLLPCGLFFSLRASQDVEGVDMGHVLIGLHARAHLSSRRVILPHFGARGIEIVTWVGDLGGATARVALDRVGDRRASVERYFQGNDYGAASNLEGDVAAYVIADAGEDRVSEPQFPDTAPDVATAVLNYFEGSAFSGRHRRFLELQGGVFAGSRLTNQAEVEETIANRLAGFAPRYMDNYLREHPRGHGQAQRDRATANIPRASRDVAHHFVEWLIARMQPASRPQRRRRR